MPCFNTNRAAPVLRDTYVLTHQLSADGTSLVLFRNFKEGTGTLSCRRCDVNFSTSITYLSDPIDVYTEWIDACAAENAANASSDEDEEGDVFDIAT